MAQVGSSHTARLLLLCAGQRRCFYPAVETALCHGRQHWNLGLELESLFASAIAGAAIFRVFFAY